jgi:hypothetical protein
MNMLKTMDGVTSGWFSACILLCAVILLASGVAYAQNPDFEAVGTRLIEAVEVGELTPEQATAMMGALACTSFSERLKGIHDGHDERELDEEEEGIEGYFIRLGLEEEQFDRLREHLDKSGFSDEQNEQSLGGMLRLVHEMQEAGEDVEMDPRLLNYFKEEVALTDEQVTLVRELARQVSNVRRHREHEQGEKERLVKYRAIESRIRTAVETGRLSREEAEMKLMETRRQMFERKEERRSGAGIKEWIMNVGKRLKAAVRSGSLSEEDAWAKWYEIKENEFGPQLKRAVKNGKMTEKEAMALWHAIEKMEADEKDRQPGKNSNKEEKREREKREGREKKVEERDALSG